MSYSKTILIGRVGTDPDMKYTQSGRPVLNFNVATDETWKDQSGKRQKQTTWHKCDLWGKRAEALQAHIHKGDRIGIEGIIQHRSYEDKDGIKRYVSSIKVTEVTLLGERREGGDRRPPQGGYEPPPDDFGEDDIPF